MASELFEERSKLAISPALLAAIHCQVKKSCSSVGEMITALYISYINIVVQD